MQKRKNIASLNPNESERAPEMADPKNSPIPNERVHHKHYIMIRPLPGTMLKITFAYNNLANASDIRYALSSAIKNEA